MVDILGADGRPIESAPRIEHTFQWAELDTVRKAVLIEQLSTGIQSQINAAVKERIITSFDADRFRRMGSKDIFLIQMVLRVPVSLMMKIIDEFNATIEGDNDTPTEVPTKVDG
jgi:hypothetical protein